MEPTDLIKSEIKEEINDYSDIDDINLKEVRTLLNLKNVHHEIKIEDYSGSDRDLTNESVGTSIEPTNLINKSEIKEEINEFELVNLKEVSTLLNLPGIQHEIKNKDYSGSDRDLRNESAGTSIEPTNLINKSEIKEEINEFESVNLKEVSTLLNLPSIYHEIKIEDCSGSGSDYDLRNESDGTLIEPANLINKSEIKEEIKDYEYNDLKDANSLLHFPNVHYEIKIEDPSESDDTLIEPTNLINKNEIKEGANDYEYNGLKDANTLLNMPSVDHEIESEDDSESDNDLRNESVGILIGHTDVDSTMCTSEKPYRCDTCFKTFTTSGSLKVHKYLHTGERPYKCNTCAKTFNQSSSLNQHKKIHTGEKSYKCNKCYKTFTNSKLGHICTEKIFKCNICFKILSSPSYLIQHKKIHTGEKPYKCDICAKAFIKTSDLKKHRRSHTGEKPYKCTTCAKTFAASGTLNIHKRTHTGEKPYKCNICAKTFIQNSNLREHEKVHTGVKPYTCHVCLYKFGHSSGLRKHKIRFNH